MLELYAPSPSLIHRWDARVKVIFTLVFILFLSLTPYRAWSTYILFLAIILSAALVSHLTVGFMVKRTLPALPFLLAAIPLIFSGSYPRVSVSIFSGFQVFYSPAGCEQFVSIALKSLISIQAAILLTATTRFPDILAALKALKIPWLFLEIIQLMWRYLFVIREEANSLLRARSSRNASGAGSSRNGGILLWKAQVTGGMAGSLFLRSIERSDRIYAAMLSRGYNGLPPMMDDLPLSAGDRKTLVMGFIWLSLIWVLGLLTGG